MNIILLASYIGIAFAGNPADKIPRTGPSGEFQLGVTTSAMAKVVEPLVESNHNRTIKDLLDKVYTGSRAADRPEICKPVPGAPQVHICTTKKSQSSGIKISSLDFAPYPLNSGLAQFELQYKLHDAIKVGTKMHLDAFRDDESIFSGVVDFCSHAKLAEQPCPIKSTGDKFEFVTRTLLIPDETPRGVYSYVVKLESPNKVELLRFAAILDVRTDMKSPLKFLDEKEQDIEYVKHDL